MINHTHRPSSVGPFLFVISLLASVFFLLFTALPSLAQTNLRGETTPLEKRNVAGYLRDSLNKPIPGATVSLYSDKDTLQTSTNNFGYYGFQNVMSADFLLSIKALGYDPYNRRYYNNDTREQLNIPPIRLGVKTELLDEVTIQGLRGPALKGDTTEFWARDYIVRDYARLEDLLRRLEGITIDQDGSVFYNGEQVVRALFNNEDYFTGSVQDAMRELPADIVERIQIIDREVGGVGARTMQTDETEKVMNIVTKEDRSAGHMYQLSAEQGTQSRTKVVGSVRRIDGRDQLTFQAGHTRTPEGIKSDPVPGSISRSMDGVMIGGGGTVMVLEGGMMGGGGSGVSDGRHKETTAAIGRNVTLGKIHVYPQYDFGYTDRWSGTHTLSERFYDEGSILSVADSRSERQEQKHDLRANFSSFSPDRSSTLYGSINAGYRKYDNYGISSSDRSGLINSIEERWTDRQGDQLNVGINVQRSTTFGKKWRLNNALNVSYNGDQSDEEDRTDVFAQDNPTHEPDSTVHQLRNSISNGWNYNLRNDLTWDLSERLKVRGGLNLNHAFSLQDLRARRFDGATFMEDPDLSNYQRTNTLSVPVTVNAEYTLPSGIYFSPGMELSNNFLNGKLNPGTPSISRFDALWRTQLSIGYKGDKYGQGSIGFNRAYQQPGVSQLNPDPVYLTPYTVQQGNPDLENSRTQSVNARYTYFFQKAMFHIGLYASYSRRDNIVVSDRIVEVDPVANIVKTVTSYRNVDGGEAQFYRGDFTRTFRRLNSTLKYNVSFNKSVNPYFLNGSLETRNALSQSHSLSFFFSPANWFEVTPDLRYQASEDDNSLATFAAKTYNRVLYGALKLGVFLPKDTRINADLTQSVHHSTNILTNTSPFVVNANIEKRIFPKKNGILSFVVMDLAQQNAFTNYHSDEQGYTNTVSNRDSRYFLLQFSWQPQVWSRSKHDAGQGRRRDGSFIR